MNHQLQVTALWSMLESFSNPFFTLILIPIFIYSLGLDKYGLYVMIIAFLSLFSFTSLGMSTAITYYLALNHQNSDINYISKKIGTSIAITLLGTVVSSLIILFFYSVYSPELYKIYPQLFTYQYIVLIILILLITTQFDVVMSAALKGLRVFEESSKLEFFIRLFNFLVLSIVTITLKNLLMVIFFALLLSIFNLYFRYKKLAKLVNFNFKQITLNKTSALELIHFGKWMTLQNISGAIFGSLDKIVLGYYNGSALVGTYNILVSVTQLSHYFLANTSSFISPKIAASKASMIELRKKYSQSLTISACITIFIVLILAAVYPLMASYFGLNSVRNEYFILLISYGVLAMCIPPYYFALGFGKVKLLSNINTLSAVVGVLAIFILVHKYEMLGAVISRVIYTSFVTITFLIPALIFKKPSR